MMWITDFLGWQGLTNLAILFSAGIAIKAIRSARRNTQQQNAIELLLSLQRDREYLDNLQELRTWRKRVTQGDLVKMAELLTARREAEGEEDKDILKKSRNVLRILNYFEDISIGIGHGIYDEKIIKEAFVSTFIETWEDAKPVVLKIREIENKKSYFGVYEKQAERWKQTDN